MARWKGFEVWQGRWPHWRAEGVTYHVAFKHKRELTAPECHELFVALLRAERKGADYLCLCVLPDRTDALLRIVGDHELSDVVEKAKVKAGRAIIKRSGERYPPFGGESYDRIMRDDEELEATFIAVVSAPEELGLSDDEEWPSLFVSTP